MTEPEYRHADPASDPMPLPIQVDESKLVEPSAEEIKLMGHNVDNLKFEESRVAATKIDVHKPREIAVMVVETNGEETAASKNQGIKSVRHVLETNSYEVNDRESNYLIVETKVEEEIEKASGDLQLQGSVTHEIKFQGTVGQHRGVDSSQAVEANLLEITGQTKLEENQKVELAKFEQEQRKSEQVPLEESREGEIANVKVERQHVTTQIPFHISLHRAAENLVEQTVEGVQKSLPQSVQEVVEQTVQQTMVEGLKLEEKSAVVVSVNDSLQAPVSISEDVVWGEKSVQPLQPKQQDIRSAKKRVRRVGKAGPRKQMRAEQGVAEETPPARVLSKHDEKWNQMFLKLVDYKAAHGSTLVPQCYDQDARLGRWVHYQRVEYWIFQQHGNGKITPERIARLQGIGFEWDPQRAQWNSMFVKLLQFSKEHGHCKVPKGYTKDPELANWVRNQRLEHANLARGKKSRMTEDRLVKLNDLGFKWSVSMPQKIKKLPDTTQPPTIHANTNAATPDSNTPTQSKVTKSKPLIEIAIVPASVQTDLSISGKPQAQLQTKSKPLVEVATVPISVQTDLSISDKPQAQLQQYQTPKVQTQHNQMTLDKAQRDTTSVQIQKDEKRKIQAPEIQTKEIQTTLQLIGEIGDEISNKTKEIPMLTEV